MKKPRVTHVYTKSVNGYVAWCGKRRKTKPIQPVGKDGNVLVCSACFIAVVNDYNTMVRESQA